MKKKLANISQFCYRTMLGYEQCVCVCVCVCVCTNGVVDFRVVSVCVCVCVCVLTEWVSLGW